METAIILEDYPVENVVLKWNIFNFIFEHLDLCVTYINEIFQTHFQTNEPNYN